MRKVCAFATADPPPPRSFCPLPPLRCEKQYFRDAYADACVSCSKTSQAAAPLIVIGVIVGLLLSVAAYLYCFHYEKTLEWYKKRKENLFMRMNQGTLVVSLVGPARRCLLAPSPSPTPPSDQHLANRVGPISGALVPRRSLVPLPLQHVRAGHRALHNELLRLLPH